MLSFVRTLATVDWRRFICLPDTRPELVADRRDVEARVPDVDVPHLREARHRFAVLAHRRRHDRAAGRIVEAALPAGDRETGGKPLDVPLERPRQRLVEVVEAEDEPPVRRGEDAEVREVRVAAELGVQIPVRGPSARSAAMRYAPPRKNANGDTSMRPYRIGPSSGRRVCA